MSGAKTDCTQFREALAEAALGGVPEAGLRGHLAECASCGAELQRLAVLAGAIDRGVSQMVSGEPSPGFAARVRARVAEAPEQDFAWWRGWAPATAAGVAVLALAAWLLWPQAQRTTPSDVPTIVKKEPTAPRELTPDAPAKGATPTPDKRGERQEVAANPRVRAPRAPVTPRPSETPALPEVLVTGEEWAQVVKLYRLGQSRLTASGALVARSFTPPEDKVLPFGIEFIQIKPLEGTKPGEHEVNSPSPDGVLRMNVDSKEAAK